MQDSLPSKRAPDVAEDVLVGQDDANVLGFDPPSDCHDRGHVTSLLKDGNDTSRPTRSGRFGVVSSRRLRNAQKRSTVPDSHLVDLFLGSTQIEKQGDDVARQMRIAPASELGEPGLNTDVL